MGKTLRSKLARLLRPSRRLLVAASITLASCVLAVPHAESPPNIALPTFGGLQLWSDVYWQSGWRIQEHSLSGHYRLLDPGDTRRAWGSQEHCRAEFEERRSTSGSTLADPDGERDHLVILLHGLGRSRHSLGALQQSLEAEGYGVAALSYASTRRSIEAHVDRLQQLCEQLEGVTRVSFVTHSLGGIIARELLGRDSEWEQRVHPDRLVMLAPPSQGSSLARLLTGTGIFDVVMGPAGVELGENTAASVPLPDIPFGIVSGYRGTPGGWNPLLSGDDDGIVSVHESKLPGASMQLMVKSVHTLLMRHPAVIQAVADFLESESRESARKRDV